MENWKKLNMNVIRSGHVLSNDHWELLNLSFSPEEIKMLFGVFQMIKPEVLMGIIVNFISQPGPLWEKTLSMLSKNSLLLGDYLKLGTSLLLP